MKAAAELMAQFYTLQKLTSLEHENQRLKAEAERARTAQDAAECRADYYRRQLVLESRHGLMLTSLMA